MPGILYHENLLRLLSAISKLHKLRVNAGGLYACGGWGKVLEPTRRERGEKLAPRGRTRDAWHHSAACLGFASKCRVYAIQA